MKKILTILLVLAFGVFAHAQYFDMQRSLNINGESNPIRPEITNEFSHLGAAYTLGAEAGNLTGNYGNSCAYRMFRGDGDMPIQMITYNNKGELIDMKLFEPNFGFSSTMGVTHGVSVVIAVDKGICYISGAVGWPLVWNSSLFDKLGGYVDYVAISGSGGQVIITNFQFGNGWIDNDFIGFTNMATIRGDGINSNGNFTFGSGNSSVTFTSKAVAWNAETGVAMSGSFATGGFLGMQGWNHLTFTFGSFERHPVTDVPEPGTLLMLGLAAAGIPVVRRLRKG